MENRLAVAANQRDMFRRDTKFAASDESRVGEKFSQTKIQLAENARSDGLLFRDAKNFLAMRKRKFHGGMAEQFGIQMRRRARNASQRNIDTIGGSTRHHAENKHGLVAHEICFFSSERRLSASSGFNWSRSASRSFSST